MVAVAVAIMDKVEAVKGTQSASEANPPLLIVDWAWNLHPVEVEVEATTPKEEMEVEEVATMPKEAVVEAPKLEVLEVSQSHGKEMLQCCFVWYVISLRICKIRIQSQDTERVPVKGRGDCALVQLSILYPEAQGGYYAQGGGGGGGKPI